MVLSLELLLDLSVDLVVIIFVRLVDLTVLSVLMLVYLSVDSVFVSVVSLNVVPSGFIVVGCFVSTVLSLSVLVVEELEVEVELGDVLKLLLLPALVVLLLLEKVVVLDDDDDLVDEKEVDEDVDDVVDVVVEKDFPSVVETVLVCCEVEDDPLVALEEVFEVDVCSFEGVDVDVWNEVVVDVSVVEVVGGSVVDFALDVV